MIRKSLWTVLVFTAMSLGGCAVVPYDGTFEIDSTTTISDLPPYSCGSCQSSFDVSLDWRSDVNVDLELLTPSHILVGPNGSSVGGCSHSGDDLGGFWGGAEDVFCSNPDWGTYEARLINVSDVKVLASLHSEERLAGSGSVVVVDQDVWLDPWAMVVVPIQVR